MNTTEFTVGTFAGIEIPITCELQAIAATERSGHLALADHLYGTLARERRVNGESVEFRFDADAYDAVTRYVANERLCCAFVHFAIEVTPYHGPIWLSVTGGDEMSAVMSQLNLAGATK